LHCLFLIIFFLNINRYLSVGLSCLLTITSVSFNRRHFFAVLEIHARVRRTTPLWNFTRRFVPALKSYDRIALKPLIRSADCTPLTRDKFQVSPRITLRLNTLFSTERNRLASSRHASRSASRYNIDPRLKIDKATRGDSSDVGRTQRTSLSVILYLPPRPSRYTRRAKPRLRIISSLSRRSR